MENKLQPIKRQALARSAQLGSFYNVINDDFNGLSLYKVDLRPYISSTICGGNEYEYTKDDGLNSKYEKLKVEGELKCSILAGLVKLEGSGNYLSDDKKSNKTIRISFLYKVKTKEESVQIYRDELLKPESLSIEHMPQICEIASHVVTSITYGANVIATFELEEVENLRKRNVDGALEAIAKKLGDSISGKVSAKYDEDEMLIQKNLKISIFSDIMHPVVKQYDEFEAFLKDIHRIIEIKYENKGVPIEYRMSPLAFFPSVKAKDQAKVMTRQVKTSILNSISKMMEDVTNLLREFDTLIQDCERYSSVLGSDLSFLKKEREKLEREFLDLRDRIRTYLQEYRRGTSESNEKESSPFEDILREFEKSEANPEILRQQLKDKIDSVKRKLDFLQDFSELEKKVTTRNKDSSGRQYEEFQRKFQIISEDKLNDTFSGPDEISVFIFKIDLNANKTSVSQTNEQISFFSDLAFDNKYQQAKFYVMDCRAKNDEEILEPTIHYYKKRTLVTKDFLKYWKHTDEVYKKLNFQAGSNCLECQTQGEFDRTKTESKDSTMYAFFTGPDIWNPEKNSEDMHNINCFKLYIHDPPTENCKFLLVRQESFSNHEDMSDLKHLRILLYHKGQLLSKDYYKELAYIDQILELLQSGAKLAQAHNLQVMAKDKERYAFVYSRSLVEANKEKFDSLSQGVKEELEVKHVPVWIVNYDTLLADKEHFGRIMCIDKIDSSSCELLCYENNRVKSSEFSDLDPMVKFRSKSHAKKLSKIELNWKDDISDAYILGVAKQLSNIKFDEFKLRLANTRENSIKKLISNLDRFSSITYLEAKYQDAFMRSPPITPFISLMESLIQLKNLRYLEFKFEYMDQIKEDQLLKLGESIANLKSLTYFHVDSLNCGKLTDKALILFSEMVTRLSNLDYLHLEFFRASSCPKAITPQWLIILIEYMPRLEKLTHLDLVLRDSDKVSMIDNVLIELRALVPRLKSLNHLFVQLPNYDKITEKEITKLKECTSSDLTHLDIALSRPQNNQQGIDNLIIRLSGDPLSEHNESTWIPDMNSKKVVRFNGLLGYPQLE